MKKGKPFEDKTSKIVKQFNPNKNVNQNVYIEGKLSKVKREVDVQLVDPTQFDFLALECKDHKRTLDVEIVEAFNTKLKDIGAKKGGIVSNSPYSGAAQNMAEGLGIDLLHIIDTSDESIHTHIYATAAISDISVKDWQVGISSTSNFQITYPLDPKTIVVVNDSGHRVTTFELFKRLWNDGVFIEKPGSYRYTLKEGVNIQSLDGNIAPLTELYFNYGVIEQHYVGPLKIIEATGIYNVLKKTFQTKSMKTEQIIPHEMEKKWKKVTEEELQKYNITFGTGIKSIFEI